MRILSLLLLFGTLEATIAQKIDLSLKDLTVEDFEAAKSNGKTGLGETGKIEFRFAIKKSAAETMYHADPDGGSNHTWHKTLEKKGRLFVCDLVLKNGVDLKLLYAGSMKPSVKLVLYRLHSGKIKKIKLDEKNIQVSQKDDTLIYHFSLSKALQYDIVEISYMIKEEINKLPIWYPINDISPGTESTFDFVVPSYLKYDVDIDGLESNEIKIDRFDISKTFFVEFFDFESARGGNADKPKWRKEKGNYIDHHEVFTFNGLGTKPRSMIAKLAEEKEPTF